MQSYDTIVIGLGAMGSATAYQLSQKGNRVLGIDKFAPPHSSGSSHGDTRITRLAIGEGEEYIPLVERSHKIWKEIEVETGKKLMNLNGGLIISSQAKSSINHVADFFENTITAANKFNIKHDILTASEIRSRFPHFNVKDDEVAYYEPEAGYLIPEKCIESQLELAVKYGAHIRTNESLITYTVQNDGLIEVATNVRKYYAKNLVITVGSWLPELVDEKIARHFSVHRQVLYWFDVSKSSLAFEPEQFPIFIWELQGEKQGIYGFPAVNGKDGGIKVATEQFISTTTPDTISRDVSEEETDFMFKEHVQPYINGVDRKCLKSATCLYTVTKDFGFIIDRHPEHNNIVIVSPCSGHGFKHSAAIGEAVAEMIIDGESSFDLSKFSLSRFN